MATEKVRVFPDGGHEYTVEKAAVAHINPVECVNCGTCRENCPVGAIEEQQRVICRLCPACTDKPAMTLDEMEALSTKEACTTACPLGVMPQGYINLTKIGKTQEAFELIWDKNPLPGICGRICNHPCETACKRGQLVDEPMAIRGVKRFLSDTVDFAPKAYPDLYEETVAIVGAGPAGLTCAHYLARKGYKVTVFDENAKAGGMLQRAVPLFRMPRDVVDQEAKRLQDGGIEFKLGTKVGKAKLKALTEEYDAVVIAAGSPNAKELKVQGWRSEGIMTALNFMENFNHYQSVDNRHPGQFLGVKEPEVVVVGGGAVAFDAARSAVRLGAKSVKVVCVESGEDIPCPKWEMDPAFEEGVTLLEGYAPHEFTTDHSKVNGVIFDKVTDFKKDEDGRISFSTDASKQEKLSADWVIVAVGQAPDALWSEFEGCENVFFAGDIRSKTCSVVDAMASGKKAAMDIDAKLRGRSLKDELDLRVLHQATPAEKIYPANRLKIERPDMPILPAADRVTSVDEEVEYGYDAKVIQRETMRCLECGYQKVDVNKCIGCGICQKLCPKGNAITMEPIQ